MFSFSFFCSSFDITYHLAACNSSITKATKCYQFNFLLGEIVVDGAISAIEIIIIRMKIDSIFEQKSIIFVFLCM